MQKSLASEAVRFRKLKIIRAVRRGGCRTIEEIANRTGESWTDVRDSLRSLIEWGKLDSDEIDKSALDEIMEE